ncbi:ribosome biogenesis GTP-binding protein YihA/YsxC [Flavobacteriaceae bacterium F08102]|nr:ribosome biogenesis GTP-binding protein YihA/YsxC [Flavobacteriaceae bacterium F08102]
MKIKTADFVISNTEVSKCPPELLPEYAFIGRSNVGKSSLINMLVDRKNLAKTSGKPGKTQLINHFLINKEWFLVDLPGYGYAQISKDKRRSFQEFITAYFLKRRQLICTFILIDIRHEPQKIDLEFMRFLGEREIPFCIIFTKADKVATTKMGSYIKSYQKKLIEAGWVSMPTHFITSATSNRGKDDVLNYIDEINNQLEE